MNRLLKIAGSVGLGCVVCLLLVSALREPHAQDKPASDAIATQEAKRKAVMQQRTRARARQRQVDFGENEAFYRVIIDNNLFRPLGWKKPNEKPSYSLLGTVVDTDTAIAQAILQETRSNRYYFVTVGEKVGDATVKAIQPKQVILDEEGKAITLKAGSLQFLTQSRSRGGTERGFEPREGGAAKRGNEGGKASVNPNQNGMRPNRQPGRFEMSPELAEKFRNASPEARRKMMEQEFRKRRASRRSDAGGRRGNRGER